jgi:hypothetical protein
MEPDVTTAPSARQVDSIALPFSGGEPRTTLGVAAALAACGCLLVVACQRRRGGSRQRRG